MCNFAATDTPELNAIGALCYNPMKATREPFAVCLYTKASVQTTTPERLEKGTQYHMTLTLFSAPILITGCSSLVLFTSSTKQDSRRRDRVDKAVADGREDGSWAWLIQKQRLRRRPPKA